MIGLVLSVFDKVYGPKIFLKIPESHPQIRFEHIPTLMDIYNEGFFLHEFDELKTANLIFTISSPIARGEKEVLMISIISFEEEFYKIDLSSFEEVLSYFSMELTIIPDLYKAFHPLEFSDSREASNAIRELMDTFYNSIIERFIHFFKKEVTYELSSKGKQMIIEDLKVKLLQSRGHLKKTAISDLY